MPQYGVIRTPQSRPARPGQPIKVISRNAGLEGGVVVEKVRTLGPGEGLTPRPAGTATCSRRGVVDAAKVTRSALQNAASIAALLLTTEAIVADKPEEKMPPMPGGGDMDF